MIKSNNDLEHVKKKDTFVPNTKPLNSKEEKDKNSLNIKNHEIKSDEEKKDEKVKNMIQKFNTISQEPPKVEKELKSKTIIHQKPEKLKETPTRKSYAPEKPEIPTRKSYAPEKKEKPEEKKETRENFEKEKNSISKSEKKEISKVIEKKASVLKEIKEKKEKIDQEKTESSPKFEKRTDLPTPKNDRRSLGEKFKGFVTDLIKAKEDPKESPVDIKIIKTKETPTTPNGSPCPENITVGPIPKPKRSFTDHLDFVCTEALLHSTKAGFLLKLGGKVKNWKKRFFVLVDHTLFYYYDQKAKEPRGAINLSIPNMAEMYDKEKFKFTITTTTRIFYITAENEQSAESWVLAINQAVKYQKEDVETYQRLDSDKRNVKILNRDYDGYEVNFFAVFTVPELKKAFMNHLEKELNTEPFEFLLDLEKMKNEISKETIDQFNQLCDLYIKSDAKKSLNVPGQERAKVLRHLRSSSKLNWISDQTPLEVFEPIRRIIILDMRGEPFPRFLQSDSGYEIVSKNYFNPEVITQNPLELVLYKIKNSFYGDSVDENEVREYAGNLSNKNRLKNTYLSTNWVETVKLSEMIKKSFSKENLKSDESLFGISEKTLSGTIKVKIVILDKPKLMVKKQGMLNFFYPLSHKFSTSTDLESDENESYHTCLMIGPWILSWDESEICIPKKCVSNAALIVADLDSICVLKNLDDKIDKLADVIIEWNTNKKYHPNGMNYGEEYGNSQNFVECLMKSLEIKEKIPNILENFLKVAKIKGGSEMCMELTPQFQKKFSLTKKQIVFKTHSQLDEFLIKLKKMDLEFESNHKEEMYLLKSFDRAFWIKYINVQSEILKIKEEKKKVTIEKLDRDFEKFDKEMKTKNEETITCKPYQKIDEDDHSCPFDDPLKTQSLIM